MHRLHARSCLSVVFALILAAAAAGCAGDEGSLDGVLQNPTTHPSQAPFRPADDMGDNSDNYSNGVLLILSIDPASGPAGTQVTVEAEGFDPESDSICFGMDSLSCKEVEFTLESEEIAFEVPANATPGTNIVALRRGNTQFDFVRFEVTEPADDDGDDADADDDADVEEEGNPELVGVRCVAGGGAFIRSESGYAEYRYQPLYKPCLFAKPRRKPACAVGRICPRTPPQCARDGCPDPRVRDHFGTDPRETDTRDEALREDNRTDPERERAGQERRRQERRRPSRRR